MEDELADSFSRIMQGLKEAVEHARGAGVPGSVLHVPEHVDVATNLRRTGLIDESMPGTASLAKHDDDNKIR